MSDWLVYRALDAFGDIAPPHPCTIGGQDEGQWGVNLENAKV